MEQTGQTGLARVLSQPDVVAGAAGLALSWADQTLTLRLRGAGRAPADIGGHLRRSFLGALGPGASPEAQAGRPCCWEPPCALDVFRREQLRGPRGDGLPKPYVIAAWPEGRDLIVTLRVIGMAIDWAMAAFEAMVVGIGSILPWSKLLPELNGPPEIASRQIDFHRIALTDPPAALRLSFLSLMDASGTDAQAEPHTVLARALRRADALSRWNGMALDPDVATGISAGLRQLDYDTSALRPGRYSSPNRHRQTRQDPALGGGLLVRGDLTDIWPALLIAERAHIGRKAVEGLGRVRLERLE